MIVTGAGGASPGARPRLRRRGALVVVNDIGAELDGSGGSTSPAQEVVAEIEAAGGRAVVNGDDVADWARAQRLVETAIEVFGGLDVVVNNAGFVHGGCSCRAPRRSGTPSCGSTSRGTSACRGTQRRGGGTGPRRARPSTPGSSTPPPGGHPRLGGPVVVLGGQGRHRHPDADPGGELGRYGVTANAIAPAARTRMTEGVFTEMMAAVAEGEFDHGPGQRVAARGVAGLVTSADVTGRLFEVEGGKLSVAEGGTAAPPSTRASDGRPPRSAPPSPPSSETPAPRPRLRHLTPKPHRSGGRHRYPPVATATSPWFGQEIP